MLAEGNAAPVSLIRSPWSKTLDKLVFLADDHLLIACPYLKRSITRRITSLLDQRGICGSVSVILVADLRPESSLAGSMDLDALSELGRALPGFELTHLPGVHAKVYVADFKMAIVTSGNLTEPGVSRNVEYGIALTEEGLVKEIRSDLEGYASLGARVSMDDVAALSAEMEELKALFQQAQKSIRKRARRAFEDRLKSTNLRLLRQRAKGKTTHAIFSDTLRFILAKGPLRTEELQPLVQLLHPDLCDDSADRVIDGVHFGKKWKHNVRTAQQFLKRHGEIRFDGERWHLVSS